MHVCIGCACETQQQLQRHAKLCSKVVKQQTARCQPAHLLEEELVVTQGQQGRLPAAAQLAQLLRIARPLLGGRPGAADEGVKDEQRLPAGKGAVMGVSATVGRRDWAAIVTLLQRRLPAVEAIGAVP